MDNTGKRAGALLSGLNQTESNCKQFSLLQTGLEKLGRLRVLFCSNNKLKDWAEIDRLKNLPALVELLLAGNPLYTDFKDKQALPEYRLEVFCR